MPDVFDDLPEWGQSERGHIVGFYGPGGDWIKWTGDDWEYRDGGSAYPPGERELQYSDLLAVEYTNTRGDRVVATVTGGIDVWYDLDEAIHDLDERDSGQPA